MSSIVCKGQHEEPEDKIASPEQTAYTGNGLPSIFLDDAVRAINKAAKELYDLQFIATDELTGIKRVIQEVEDVFTTLPPETNSRLNAHDAQFESVHKHISQVEARIMTALEDIASKVTYLDESKKGEEAREKAKQWRADKEAEMDRMFEDSVHQALSNLAPIPLVGLLSVHSLQLGIKERQVVRFIN
ncbi:hypothetical protein OROGR_006993 [Orobanche gracilis]